MDALLHAMLKLGLSRAPVSQPPEGQNGADPVPTLKLLTVEPVKVVDVEGKLYVQYPSRTDLQFDDIDVKRYKD